MTADKPPISRATRQVLVLGSSGMAGHVVSKYLEERGREVTKVAGSYKSDPDTEVVDVTDRAHLDQILRSQPYAAVVNCIGSLVKASERQHARATYLNSYLPHYLEQAFCDSDTKVLHLSTDCVFAGTNAPYVESDFRDGPAFYDRSKALGEIENGKDITLRMSLIGPEMRESGTGLMHWFLGQSGEVRGFTGAIWNGITTLELAKAIDQLIDSELSGIYHLVPDHSISKFALLGVIKDVFEREDILLMPDGSVSLDKTLVDTRKEVPFSVAPRGYRGMIEDVRAWTGGHSRLYGSLPRYASEAIAPGPEEVGGRD